MGMQRTDLADQVKSLVTIQDVAEHYGFHPNRAGYICCPFHREKTASLKLYSDQRGWCCFGCHAGGTVIDFVMKLFDIPFRQAILRINADFALGLTWDKPDPAVRSAILEARRREAQRKAKLEQLEDFLFLQDDTGRLVCVGDSLNDTPVLERADVGITLGTADSLAAAETAGIILMENELSKIIDAVRIARGTLRAVSPFAPNPPNPPQPLGASPKTPIYKDIKCT